ncbi:hypothetical protein ORI20_32025 [Mycobacterium sp. CVI_P3]|uniref:Uncharacterized protein n=1 Tax=Mycobacterium pinniadriaticum TaxID=2994102 RepID=A0ABT3SP57_9MYCO|nr:hypothetical protein [Mycobacterium pinniadriaticum]MCX2934894.1 hypothetical protein [Mycobacterium pinniadriaticum]MCX2941316.1 hypothetical protein [Mycobacterium pinniadriaticum]
MHGDTIAISAGRPMRLHRRGRGQVRKGEDIAELYDYVAADQLAVEVTEIGFGGTPQGLDALEAHNVTGRLVALF